MGVFLGKHRLLDATIPALVEFSRYGIHKIDGKSTVCFPTKICRFSPSASPRAVAAAPTCRERA